MVQLALKMEIETSPVPLGHFGLQKHQAFPCPGASLGFEVQ